MYRVGITGGIGSGKSTLCQLFSELGIPIYNSDAKAKALMSRNSELQNAIVEAFGEESYIDGQLNRHYLSSVVFTDREKLLHLNSLVHPRVKVDFDRWSEEQDAPYVILECAILFDAGFNEHVNSSVCVLSPKDMRIERVISRDGLTTQQVEERIANQLPDDKLHSLCDLSVVNFDVEDLEDAAKVFDKKFRYEAQRN
ncbi:MAG: dephospho-CoA kinase [Rikenellaceae bacterium]